MGKKCLYLIKACKYVLGQLSKREGEYYDKHIPNCDFCSALVKNIKDGFAKKTKDIFGADTLEELVAKAAKSYRQLREFDRELRAKGCPATDECLRYVDGKLYSKKRLYIEEHIKSCKDCREGLEILKGLKERGELD
ncbi:MAG: hypothetical protein AB1393_07665 [Candidatus Edwardsbacteria bacterium]